MSAIDSRGREMTRLKHQVVFRAESEDVVHCGNELSGAEDIDRRSLDLETLEVIPGVIAGHPHDASDFLSTGAPHVYHRFDSSRIDSSTRPVEDHAAECLDTPDFGIRRGRPGDCLESSAFENNRSQSPVECRSRRLDSGYSPFRGIWCGVHVEIDHPCRQLLARFRTTSLLFAPGKQRDA